MMRPLYRVLTWLLIVNLVLGVLPASAQAPVTPPANDAGKTLDTMLNYDYKSRAAKIIFDGIRGDRQSNRPINWGAIREKLTGTPFLVNMGISGGSEITGTLIQAGMVGLWPPFGVIAGSTISAVMNAGGGAIGYEVSAAMESGEQLTAKQMLGRALHNIDLPSFVGQTVGGVIGSALGQALIPIPFVGMMIGGMVGGFAGGMLVNLLRKVPAVAAWFDQLQAKWQKLGAGLMEEYRKPKAEEPPVYKNTPSAQSPFAEDTEVKVKTSASAAP